ncbi:MAG: class I SAM-dependent methyltransferase [Actinomycetota bacterium]|nr:class I SAM-dependent methyltransferase [Actinomycetota bacterium]
MAGSDDAAYWDELAATFDAQPDHGLSAQGTREAWRECLERWLPAPPCAVVDLGCGTGSLALLAAELGHRVTGIDFADAMVQRAQAKAERAGVHVRFVRGDASRPPLLPGSTDVILVRHLLWALPVPADALAYWVTLMAPGGSFVLVEGSWSTGVGLRAEEVEALVEPHCEQVTVEQLADPFLWGGVVEDERYVVRGAVRS